MCGRRGRNFILIHERTLYKRRRGSFIVIHEITYEKGETGDLYRKGGEFLEELYIKGTG